MFLILTKDLMIQSSASAAVRNHNAKLFVAPTVAAAIQKMAANPTLVMFIDLQTPGLVIANLISRLIEMPNRPVVIAFAQHVEEELLALARTDAIDKVLTRGQFSHQLPRLIAEHVRVED